MRSARGTLAYKLRARPDSAEMDSLNIREKQAFMEVRGGPSFLRAPLFTALPSSPGGLLTPSSSRP